MVEDRGVRGKPRYREFVDVAFQRAAIQQVACNVVEPDALPQIMEPLCRLHLDTTSRPLSLVRVPIAPKRFEDFVKVPIRSKASPDSISSVQRQPQFPS